LRFLYCSHHENQFIAQYRLTLAKNASGKSRSPRSIRKLLCPNSRERQADLEVAQDTLTRRGRTAQTISANARTIPGRLFGMDCVDAITNHTFYKYVIQAGPDTFAHYPSHRFDVLFTDGSVKFVQSEFAFTNLFYMEDSDWAQANEFTALENAQ
jgi:hypothetical protein